MGAMDRHLLLLRHGSADSPAGVADLDRPLAARGRADSARVGELCRVRGLAVDLVAVSPARRARETWEAYARSLGGTPEVRVDPRVYANTVEDLLELVRAVDDTVRTVLLVGHNPSVGELARGLDPATRTHVRNRLAGGYPTATLSAFTVEGSWADLVPGGCRLADVVTPTG